MHPYQKQKEQFTLSTAEQHGMLLKLRCGLCKQVHLYYARDVMTLIGDLSLWEIANNIKCEKCDKGDYLKADWKHLYGPDIGKTKVRKLVRIRLVQIPVWKEETI